MNSAKNTAWQKPQRKRNIIGEKILSFENETYQLKDEITQLMIQSRNIENEYWQNADTQEITDFQQNIKKLTETKTGNKTEQKPEPQAKNRI